MTDDQTLDPTPERPLDRRFLLRGGAVLAGAAGATAVAAVLAPTADAADGGTLTIGAANTASSTTTLTIGGVNGTTAPTLSLRNAGGASLALQALPLSFSGELKLGEIANTTLGPYIGLDDGEEVFNALLVTSLDLEDQPAPEPKGPTRLFDSRRYADYADNVVGVSSGAFDSSNRLKAGGKIDIAVASTDDNVSAVFLNIAVVSPTAKGFLTAYIGGTSTVPTASTLNYQAGVSIANAAFLGVGTVSGSRAVRITVSATTHVVVDLTGQVNGGGDFSGNKQVAANRVLARRKARQLKAARGSRPAR